MRFGISHLLVTTTIASVYAAVAGAYVARDGFSGNAWEVLASPMSLLWLFWIIGEPAYKRYVNWRESNDTSASETQTFYFPKSSWRHPTILAGFLLLSLPGLMASKASLHWSLVPTFVVFHIACELTQRVRFCDRGVFSSKGFMPWRTTVFP